METLPVIFDLISCGETDFILIKSNVKLQSQCYIQPESRVRRGRGGGEFH